MQKVGPKKNRKLIKTSNREKRIKTNEIKRLNKNTKSN